MSTKDVGLAISTELRRQEAVKLRIAGLGYEDIYNAMVQNHGRDMLPGSYDVRYVWRDVQDELKKLDNVGVELAGQLRALEARRLDMMTSALMPKVLGGTGPDIRAVNAMLRIMDHRAKLFGLYAPSQLKVRDWRSEILELIQAGKITIQQVEEEIGPELTQQLLESGSNGAVEGRFTEEEDPGSGS